MSACYALHTLVDALNDAERQLCRNYLTAFDMRGEKFDSKSLKLFELLCAGDIRTEQELEFLLYGKKNKVAFSRLLLRLRDKILEAVTLPKNSTWREQQSPYETALAGCRSKLLQAEYLLKRGLNDLAFWHLNTICDTAAHYEFFAEWAQALELLPRTKQKLSANYSRQLLKVQQQFQFCLVCTKLVHFARLSHTGASTEEIEALRTHHPNISSSRASFLLLEAEAITAQKQKNYKAEILIRRKQIRLIRNAPALQNGEFLRNTSLQLIHAYLRCGWVLPALHLVQSNSPQQGWNIPQEIELLHIETRICLMMGNVQAAGKLLHRSHSLHAGEKVVYHQAVLHYYHQQYEQAMACIYQLNWKQLGDEEYGLTVLLFAAMVAIEHHSGKTLFKELRYLLQKAPLFTTANLREKHCLDLLQTLVSAEMNFQEVYKSHLPVLDQLRMKEGETAWNALSEEIVPFHEWLICKALRVPLKPVLGNVKRTFTT
jgi:hypothetical protein